MLTATARVMDVVDPGAWAVKGGIAGLKIVVPSVVDLSRLLRGIDVDAISNTVPEMRIPDVSSDTLGWNPARAGSDAPDLATPKLDSLSTDVAPVREPAPVGATPDATAPVVREPATISADRSPTTDTGTTSPGSGTTHPAADTVPGSTTPDAPHDTAGPHNGSGSGSGSGDTQVLDHPTPHTDGSGSNGGTGAADSGSSTTGHADGSDIGQGDSAGADEGGHNGSSQSRQGSSEPAPTRIPAAPDAFDPSSTHGYGSGDAHHPGNAEVSAPANDYIRGSGEPDWTHIDPGSRDGYVDYQLQIAGVERAPDGRIPEWVEVGTSGRDVKFDGHTFRDGPPPVEVLLDAKDGYRGLNFADLSRGYWQHRADSLVAQAGRQIDAAPDGALIEWHVSDPYGAAGIRTLLEDERIFSDDIRVVYTPKL